MQRDRVGGTTVNASNEDKFSLRLYFWCGIAGAEKEANDHSPHLPGYKTIFRAPFFFSPSPLSASVVGVWPLWSSLTVLLCVCVCARQRKRHASTSRGGISVCTGEKWSFFRQHLVGRWVEIRSETEMNRRAELSTQTPNECHLRVHRARASVVFCAVIFGIYCDSYFSHFLFHARRRGAPRFAC